MRIFGDKILTRVQMVTERARLKRKRSVVVFTNGCFDLIHSGHVAYLQFARKQGDALVLGINSDASVKRNKGTNRPLVCEQDRAEVTAALECVDYVVLFDEEEPRDLIAEVLPDILVKGEDWAHYVSGREAVEAAGGKVVLAKMIAGRSTTNLIGRILEVYGKSEQAT